ncbi:MAG: hypothetical protein Q8M44_01975, partial [bacterium]|nr:hypothetical protein [bacterium]
FNSPSQINHILASKSCFSKSAIKSSTSTIPFFSTNLHHISIFNFEKSFLIKIYFEKSNTLLTISIFSFIPNFSLFQRDWLKAEGLEKSITLIVAPCPFQGKGFMPEGRYPVDRLGLFKCFSNSHLISPSLTNILSILSRNLF